MVQVVLFLNINNRIQKASGHSLLPWLKSMSKKRSEEREEGKRQKRGRQNDTQRFEEEEAGWERAGMGDRGKMGRRKERVDRGNRREQSQKCPGKALLSPGRPPFITGLFVLAALRV